MSFLYGIFGFYYFNYEISELDPFYVLQMAFGYDVPMDGKTTSHLIQFKKHGKGFMGIQY